MIKSRMQKRIEEIIEETKETDYSCFGDYAEKSKSYDIKLLTIMRDLTWRAKGDCEDMAKSLNDLANLFRGAEYDEPTLQSIMAYNCIDTALAIAGLRSDHPAIEESIQEDLERLPKSTGRTKEWLAKKGE